MTHTLPARPTADPTVQHMVQRCAHVRAQTEALAAPLSEADCQVQSMPDASPTTWQLAHVTATSSPPMHAGSSQGCGWHAASELA